MGKSIDIMTEEDIIKFRNDMKKYRYLKASINMLKERIDIIEYEMNGVKGISFDRSKGSSNPESKEYRRLEMIEEHHRLLDLLHEKEQMKKDLDKVLNRMDCCDRDMFLLKYEQGYSYERVARMMYLSKSGLYKKMNEVLKKL